MIFHFREMFPALKLLAINISSIKNTVPCNISLILNTNENGTRQELLVENVNHIRCSNLKAPSWWAQKTRAALTSSNKGCQIVWFLRGTERGGGWEDFGKRNSCSTLKRGKNIRPGKLCIIHHFSTSRNISNLFISGKKFLHWPNPQKSNASLPLQNLPSLSWPHPCPGWWRSRLAARRTPSGTECQPRCNSLPVRKSCCP